MKKTLIFIILCLVSIIPVRAENKAETINVTFDACIDGDTARFNLNNESIKVRFLAIDTPESTNKIEAFGEEASNYVCDKLKNANSIVLETDANSDKYDKYNRLLAWVFVDGNLIQKDIIANGYGKVAYLYGDYKYTDILKDAEAQAKEQKLRIWSNEKSDYDIYFLLIGVVVVINSIIFIPSRIRRLKRSFKRMSQNELF